MAKLALILISVSMLISSAVSDEGGLSIAEYRQQLRELTARVDSLGDHPQEAGQTIAVIPDNVEVTTRPGPVTVSYRDLKDDLAEFFRADTPRRTAILGQIKDYLRALGEEADAYERGTNPEAARSQLAEILARREFHHGRGPSAGQIVLDKILAWLSRVFSGLSFSGKSALDLFQILVYLLIAAALALVAIWTFRRLRRPSEEPTPREIIPFTPSARSWRLWLAEARSLAQRQDWRSAIHLAYWAGISFLEENGAWRPDRARTPREYLRLVGARTASHAPLASLTRKFEVVWYGHQDAAESDFQETLGQLERLGCR
jgi:hypothetical protein